MGGEMLDLNSLNSYGVPLHACATYRQDEHYWKWLEHKIDTEVGSHYGKMRALRLLRLAEDNYENS